MMLLNMIVCSTTFSVNMVRMMVKSI
jgi:hypothetical protein